MDSARRDTRLLRGRNLFIFLSFLGVLALGIVLLAFWYLIDPRLEEILAGLSLAVGLVILALYLGVAGLLSLIVISSYLQRDLVSAKRITVRILFPLALAIGKTLGIAEDDVRGSFIEMHNSLVRAASPLVRGDRLLLLLPHCLQNFQCPHRVTAEVGNCTGCGKCEIADLTKLCDSYGIKMSIATGGTLARRVIVESRPKAIVAVACERDLASGIQDSYPIPVIGILNERPFGPCRDTRVDLGLVADAVRFFLGRDAAPAGDLEPDGGEAGYASCEEKSDSLRT
jgi:hypothetical protein